jgi:hypothetical protein
MTESQKYYGFDLDETLGDFGEIANFLDYFYVEGASNDLQIKLRTAYKLFIGKVVANVINGSCKLFNPEILNVIDENKVENAIIYSNNSHRETLIFAKDVIEGYFERSIFCFLMEWGHPFRTEEIVKGDRGNGAKKWLTLKEGFLKGCDVKNVEPDQVLFYDDQKHHDLSKVLGENYKHIRGYVTSFDEEVNPLSDAIVESLNEAYLNGDEEYHRLSGNLYPFNNNVSGGGKKTRTRYRKKRKTRCKILNKKKVTK